MWLTAFALGPVFFFACTDKSYRGSYDTIMSPDESMLVILTVGNPDNIIAKGSGAIENGDNEVWNDASIYVYAFKRDLMTSFSTTSMQNNEFCLVDGSRDEIGNLAGKKARVGMLDSYIVWDGVEKAVYYHPGNYPYDFYGYYIDDMEIPPGQISRTDDSVSFPLEIDGSTDIMSSKAELTEEQLYRKDFTDEDRFTIINYAYSSYTARLDIVPVMYFKHLLTRLSFELYPGRAQACDVYVDSIKVFSKSKAVFTVAHKQSNKLGLDFSGDTGGKLLPLTEPDGTRLKLDTYHPEFDGDYSVSIYDRTGVPVGGSVLAAPGEDYEMHIYLKETREGADYFYENVKTLTNSQNLFQPGEHYVVRIGIYGLYDVQVDAELVPWTDGGSIVVGGDRPPTGSD